MARGSHPKYEAPTHGQPEAEINQYSGAVLHINIIADVDLMAHSLFQRFYHS